MAKPDNRSDNVEHLQEHVQNTIERMHEAEEYLDEHADEITASESQQLKEKNANRRNAIRGMRNEIEDEADHQNET